MEQPAGLDQWLTICRVFGDYETFLAIAFAVNILFGAWEAIRARLAARSIGGTAFLTSFAALIDHDTARAYGDLIGRAKRVRNRFTRAGRALSFIVAVAIAAALFWFPSNQPVATVAKWLIALSILVFPLTMTVMIAADWAFRLAARLRAGDGAMAKAMPNSKPAAKEVTRALGEPSD